MNGLLKRIAAGGCLAVAAFLGSPARAADDAHTISVRLEWLPSGYHAPFWLAAEKGWFKKAGLDVTISDGNGSVTTVQMVGNDQYDVGHAALATMAVARSKGMRLVSIAGFFRKGDIALMVPRDSPIGGPKDLKGKKIIYTAGSLETPFLDPFLASGGLTRDDLELINIDASAKVGQYLAGAADGIISAGPTVALLENKRPSRLILFADHGLNLPSMGLVASEAALARKGPAIKQFASIVSGAWAYILKGHEDEGIEAVVHSHENARLDPAVLRANLNVSLQFLYSPATKDLPVGIQSEADWASAVAIMEKAKVIDPGSKAKDYFTNDYLDAATITSLAGG
ncbi:MAG TPA: ABC transporter substrate-binding protein [Stellaceae bacterium]|nr:ABC transporter substrate-binding protein [Stellaceae bacterium]